MANNEVQSYSSSDSDDDFDIYGEFRHLIEKYRSLKKRHALLEEKFEKYSSCIFCESYESLKKEVDMLKKRNEVFRMFYHYM